MKIVGRRREPELSFTASALLLKQGARFNDGLHALPTGSTTFIPKGAYLFKNHVEADQHAQACLGRGMARVASERG